MLIRVAFLSCCFSKALPPLIIAEYFRASKYQFVGQTIYRNLLCQHSDLRYEKTGNKKHATFATKRVAKRRCAFYHPHQICLAPNQVVERFERWW